MLTIDCPKCGAPVTFRSAGLVDRVCDNCRTMLVRSDAGVAIVGVQAALPFDVSPIRIGTRGRHDGRAFEVIGRVRWAWSDGSWNEWLCLFGDGAHGWLGEAMGQYMMTFDRSDEPGAVDTIRGVLAKQVGDHVMIDGEAMAIADAREVDCVAAEGEQPFTAPPGWRILSVDLRSPKGRLVSVQRDGDAAWIYDGRYVTLADLAATDLRRIEGWAIPANG